MPMSGIGAILQLADVLLVHLRDDPLFRITIPSKTQAYLAAGKPILMGVDGDAKDLVDLAGAGVSCSPEKPEDIARAVIELFSLPLVERKGMGKRGSEFYRRELSIAAGVEKFEEVFLSAAQGKQAHFV
jgi:glycosyltransferase involved in cell wall biosynthesis